GVVAVVVRRGVRRRRLHAAESVHELVGLDGLAADIPAAVVHPGELAGHLRASVAHVALTSRIVVVDLGDTAVDVGVHPHQVLAIGAVEALRAQFAHRVAHAVVTGRRDLHVLDDEVARAVGDEPDVADAAGLRGAAVEYGVSGGRTGTDGGNDLAVAVRDVGGVDVQSLDAHAVGSVALTRHRRRTCGYGAARRRVVREGGPALTNVDAGRRRVGPVRAVAGGDQSEHA